MSITPSTGWVDKSQPLLTLGRKAKFGNALAPLRVVGVLNTTLLLRALQEAHYYQNTHSTPLFCDPNIIYCPLLCDL